MTWFISIFLIGLLAVAFYAWGNYQNYRRWHIDVMVQLGPSRESLLTDDLATYYYGEDFSPVAAADEIIQSAHIKKRAQNKYPMPLDYEVTK